MNRSEFNNGESDGFFKLSSHINTHLNSGSCLVWQKFVFSQIDADSSHDLAVVAVLGYN